MLCFLGYLSVIQIIFLPGYLLIKLFKDLELGFKIITIPFISLLINFIIFYPLSIYQLFNKISVLILLFIEIVIFIYILIKQNNIKRFNENINSIKRFKLVLNSRDTVGLVIIAITFFLMGKGFFYNFGSVFFTGDAIVSWNSWANIFFEGSSPKYHLNYPLLVPLNWSISYILMGQSIQFFVKSLMCLCYPMLAFSFFYLFKKTNKFEFILAIPISYSLYNCSISTNMFDGYIDTIVSISGFVALIIFFLPKMKNQNNYLIISSLLSCEVALTKQAGIFIFIAFPLLSYFFFFKKRYIEFLKFFSIHLFFIAITVFPYYLYTQYQIHLGINDPDIDFYRLLSNSYPTLINKFYHSFTLIYSRIQNLYIILIILILTSITKRLNAILFFTIVFPYFLIWSSHFSYSIRNLLLIFPIVSILISSGTLIICDFIGKHFIHIKNFPIFLKLIFVFGVFMSITAEPGQESYSSSLIKSDQLEKKKMGDYETNVILYNLINPNQKNNFKVFTNYTLLRHMPAFEKRTNFNLFTAHEADLNLFVEEYSKLENKYIFIYLTPSIEVERFIQNEVKNGKLKLLVNTEENRFLYEKIPL